MPLHLEKPGIRAVGVAESFRQGEKQSVLAAVVIRADLVVDGFGLGHCTVGGDDATGSIARLIRSLKRNDVNVVIVSGAILSLYNIVDLPTLARRIRLPVICLTYKDSEGIEESIRRHFAESAGSKLEAYRSLGKRTAVKLSSGRTVYARGEGVGLTEMQEILNRFTIQGSVPEPVRVARLLARTILRLSSRRAKVAPSGRRLRGSPS